ncbi:MAG TPA: FtsW/RodA/SpoVE family cell cycle protein [Prolixibacteraceae bacterium]|nr:FtsW/RodA/SpoVE family cell cycle protein [Prolixibacteraceae bacterium]
MKINTRKLIRGDKILWILLLLLSMLSLLIVYSATGALAFRQAGGNTFHFLVRQIVFLGLGFGIIVIMVNVVQVRIYSMIARAMVAVSILLLMLALGLKLAGMAGDSTGRTLNLGFFSFQPAEFAKLALVIYAAKILGIQEGSEEGLRNAFWKILIVAGIICALISLSNFSTAALLFGTVMSMMFVGRIPFRYLLMVVGAALIMLVAIYFMADKLDHLPSRFGTVRGRIERFLHGDPAAEKGITQADYAKLAIYEGGFIGKGPGNSDVANYMAAAYNDFIYAIIIEEYGLMGGTVLLLLYMILFFRGIMIVRRTNRTFPAYLVTGLTLMLVYQAMVNMGVSSGVFPVTGQPLPWVSMGGTSLLFTSVAFGCIISVSYQNQRNSQMTAEPAVQVAVPEEDQEIG